MTDTFYEDLSALLQDLAVYMDKRADASLDDEDYVPNDEMVFAHKIADISERIEKGEGHQG